MELHVVSYRIDSVARPLLLVFSSENRPLWFRHGYAVSSLMDTAYWINNNSCTEYGRIPRYGHSGSPSEDDSHTILAGAGEASKNKAPYTYNCLPPTLRHPFHGLE
ncbi:hypothetical protein Tco_0677110 [Tanacetum coccineum]